MHTRAIEAIRGGGDDVRMVRLFNDFWGKTHLVVQKSGVYKYQPETRMWERLVGGAGVVAQQLRWLYKDCIGPLLEETENHLRGLKFRSEKAAEENKQLINDIFAKRMRIGVGVGADIAPGILIELRREPDVEFDAADDLLPFRNGMVCAVSGVLRERRRENYITWHFPVDYDPGVDVAGIEAWVRDMSVGRDDWCELLQRLLGYALTGRVCEHVLVACVGEGANGKSVFLNMCERLIGEGLRTLSKDVLIKVGQSAEGAASPQLAALRGARMAVLNETDKGCVMSDSAVKSLTGGDTISCRALYEQPSSFEPKFTLFMATNNAPNIAVDAAVKRRLVLLPFDAKYKDASEFDPQNDTHRLADEFVVEGSRSRSYKVSLCGRCVAR